MTSSILGFKLSVESMTGPTVVQLMILLALPYSVDNYSHEPTPLFHHSVTVEFDASVMML